MQIPLITTEVGGLLLSENSRVRVSWYNPSAGGENLTGISTLPYDGTVPREWNWKVELLLEDLNV